MDEAGYAFWETMNPGAWYICKLSLSTNISDFLLPSEIINKSVRTKTYNKFSSNTVIERSITFYELRINNDADYLDVPENTPLPNNGTNDEVVFGRDII